MDHPEGSLVLAAERYHDAVSAAEAATAELREALLDARAAGVDLEAVARRTHLTAEDLTRMRLDG